MTHHVDARYDTGDNMFLPPQRTLGFNPQLTMNDSLLALSFVEAYDISYPEAMRRIEAEVAEVKQLLGCEGFYEMSGIGVLSLNEDGRIVFEPCEAGLLTPSLYGLGAFEMMPIDQASTVTAKSLPASLPAMKPDTVADEAPANSEEIADEDEEHAIIIKMSWIRNITAVAAAIVAFFLLTPPVANSGSQNSQQITMTQIDLLPLPKKAEPKKLDTSAVMVKHEKAPATADTLQTPHDAQQQAEKEQPAPAQAAPAVEEESVYCLVLASQVALSGAENLVSQMKKLGYEDTRINMHNNIRRVVYGRFASQTDAYQTLNKLHHSCSAFDEAWVYQTK